MTIERWLVSVAEGLTVTVSTRWRGGGSASVVVLGPQLLWKRLPEVASLGAAHNHRVRLVDPFTQTPRSHK
jgi:hypothetical protein